MILVWLLRHFEGLALWIVLAALLVISVVCVVLLHAMVLDLWNHEGLRQAFHAKPMTSGGAWWVIFFVFLVI